MTTEKEMTDQELADAMRAGCKVYKAFVKGEEMAGRLIALKADIVQAEKRKKEALEGLAQEEENLARAKQLTKDEEEKATKAAEDAENNVAEIVAKKTEENNKVLAEKQAEVDALQAEHDRLQSEITSLHKTIGEKKKKVLELQEEEDRIRKKFGGE